MRTTPWMGKENVQEGSDYAASYINHDEAVSYCQKLTSQEHNAGRLPKGWKYALPTEAQWEYACRAGTKTKYWFGENEALLGEFAWFDENAFEIDARYAHRVGQKKANPWGFKDMHGNVWEWCGDWYGAKVAGGRDPIGPLAGAYRVRRGGCWNDYAVDCRSADRNLDSPDYRYKGLGFRLAAVPE